MKRKVDIAVSTLSVKNLQDIVDYAKSLQGIADIMHCDVLDGEFVKDKTYDYNFIRTLNSQTLLPLDVHLMTNEPLATLEEYLNAGANIVTVHYEAFKDKKELLEALALIRSKNALAGISFKPTTPFKEVKSYLFYADVALVMGVDPGKCGQGMLDSTFNTISEVYKFRQDNKLNFKIEVDGGVNEQNAHLLAELGCDILVSGSYVYKSSDRAKAIKKLKN